MRRTTNQQRPQPKIKVCTPQSSHGWLEYKLNQIELDYVWSCVNDKRNSWSHNLAGNIDGSYKLEDRSDWFFNNTLTSLVNSYENTFESLGDKEVLDQWWVNYQKQYDFNPSHNHDGVYSFVIWLKIPYEWDDQNKDNKSKSKMKGSFCFSYINMLGENERAVYQLGKQHEGTMLLFPSTLNHEVFPFYNCEEDRISVSGNIT